MTLSKGANSGRAVFGIGLSLLMLALVVAWLNDAARPAPTFDLPTLEGEQLSLSSLRGKPVLLNFWASWCAPCREEMPDLEAAYQRYRGDGFVVVGVNVYETAEQAKAFASQFDVTFPIVLDQDASVASRFGVSGLPVSILIDGDGRIVFRQMGRILPETLEAQLEPILAATSNTGP